MQFAQQAAVFVSDEQIIAQVELPIAGLVSEAPLAKIADDFAAVRHAMNKLVDWQPPYLVLRPFLVPRSSVMRVHG